MTLPYSSSTPADDPMKKEECHKAAMAVRNMLEKVKQREREGGGCGRSCIPGAKYVVYISLVRNVETVLVVKGMSKRSLRFRTE